MTKVRVLSMLIKKPVSVPLVSVNKRFVKVDNRNSPVGYDLFHRATGKSVGHGKPEWIHPGDLWELEVLYAHDTSPDYQFLVSRGWLPLGKNATTGLDGWGRIIDGKAVTVDQPEALRIEKEGAK